MLHISTQDGYGVPEVISPRGIARGQGDRYLLALNRRIDEAGRAGLRAADGRDEPDQQRLLRVQPQRLARAGPSPQHERVQGRVAALHADPARRPASPRSTPSCERLPACRGAGPTEDLPRAAALACCGCRRPRARRTSPPTAVARTGPAAQYVDWVGTDFYSRFPAFAKLERFYAQYPGKPFVFGEWAMWGARQPGLRQAASSRWINAHRRVKMHPLQPGRAHQRPVPAQPLPAVARGDPGCAPQPPLPRSGRES